jgi:hypothetical protein
MIIMVEVIYGEEGYIELAINHYPEVVNLFEVAGNLYNAGDTHRNIAVDFLNPGRFTDALIYARATLDNFELFGQETTQDIRDTQG